MATSDPAQVPTNAPGQRPRRPRHPGLGLALGLALALAVGAGRGEPIADATRAADRATRFEGAEPIRRCLRRNAPQQSVVSELSAVNFDRAGSGRRLGASGYWKRFPDRQSRMLLYLDAPPEVRGASYLSELHERRTDIFVYLPELGRVRRINARAARGSLFGTSFSYEDFEHLMRTAGGSETTRLPDSSWGGRETWELENRPGPERASAYDRIVFHIGRNSCLLLGAEFYGLRDRLEKRFSVMDPGGLEQRDGRWLLRRFQMHDLVEDTRTEVTVDELEIDVELPDRTFSQSRMRRRR